MSDTNINAFEAEVQEAEKQLAVAQNNLDGAKQRLSDKKVELGIVDEPDQEDTSDADDGGTDEQKADEAESTLTVMDEEDTDPELPVAGDVVAPDTAEPTEPTKIEVQHES